MSHSIWQVCACMLQLKEHTHIQMACICYHRTGSFYLYIYLFIPFWICVIFIACMDLHEEQLVRKGTTRVFSLKLLVGQEGVFLVPTDLAKSLMETERTLWVWYSSKNTLFGWKSSCGLRGKILPPFFRPSVDPYC